MIIFLCVQAFVSGNEALIGGNEAVIIAFTSVGSHTWTVPEGVYYVDVLVVAGGGGGGSYGGGGAGGLIWKEDYFVSPGSNVDISVGTGGLGGQGGINGEDSQFGTLIAIGGGAGGSHSGSTPDQHGQDGGSGGGGGTFSGGRPNKGIGLQPSSIHGGFGNDGGQSLSSYMGSGGGGASNVGGDGATSSAGDGGDGKYFGDIFGEEYGANGWFAGGGGGGAYTSNAPGTGKHGGGDGTYRANNNNHATPNTGSGGGGAGQSSRTGSNGGSGIILIRYQPHLKGASIESGLVGHWRLDEAWYDSSTNRVTDSTPYENHGTNNGATFTTDRKGRTGSAMEFDGTSEYIGVPNDQSLDVTGELTISAWIKPYSFGKSNWGLIDRGGYSQYQLKVDTGGRAVSSLWHNGARRDYCYGVGDGAPLNGWSHVLITYDGVGTVESYLDGIHQCSHTQNEGAIDSKVTTLNIGRASSYYWDGLLDDVRIYNRALSGEEVNLLYESYRPQATQGSINQGLIGYWPLTSTWTKGGSAGSEIVTDRTPYSNDGQNSGATLTGEGAIFSGNTDYINVDDSEIFQGSFTALSFSYWFKVDSFTGDYQAHIHRANVDTIGSSVWWGGLDKGNRITATIGARDGSWDDGRTNMIPDLGEWYHLVGTWDGSKGRVFVNGDQIHDYNKASITNVVSLFAIGQMHPDLPPGSRTYYTNSNLANVRIYDRALSGEEVELLYELGR